MILTQPEILVLMLGSGWALSALQLGRELKRPVRSNQKRVLFGLNVALSAFMFVKLLVSWIGRGN